MFKCFHNFKPKVAKVLYHCLPVACAVSPGYLLNISINTLIFCSVEVAVKLEEVECNGTALRLSVQASNVSKAYLEVKFV